MFTLNEYYIDKLDEKICKIDLDIYNKEWQNLIELLLQKDYHKRPNIEEVSDYIKRISKEIKKPEFLSNNDLEYSLQHYNKDFIIHQIKMIKELMKEKCCWMKKLKKN